MENFSIRNIVAGSWAVELIVEQKDLNDNEIVKILRKAKGEISTITGIPISSLRYKDLVKTRSGIDSTKISMVITQNSVEKCDPVLKYIALRSGGGFEYDDMVLNVNLNPLSKNGEKSTAADVRRVLEKDGVPLDTINNAALEKALAKVHAENKSVKDLKLAQGRFPDPSRDAEIKYLVKIKMVDDNNYTANDKVDADQVILRKKPSVKGVNPGMDVRGNIIEPETPKDIELTAGDNVMISEDGLEAVSQVRGMLNIHVISSYSDGIESTIEVSVEPVEVIDGSEPVRITIDRPVEIVGNLKSGSKIISQREVLVSGDIEENASIQTAGSIFIEGNVIGSSLSSEKDIEADNVKSSVLMAEGKLVINGIAENSNLTGHEVFVNEVAGCNITAGKKIEINLIRANQAGFTAKLTAGLVSHLEEIIKENEKFIVFADTNLDKLKSVFGEEIVESANPENIAQMMMMHAENLRRMGFRITSSEQNDAVRQLIGTIAPIRELRNDKNESITDLESKKVDGFSTNPQIVIQHPVEHAVEIDLEGRRDTIFPKDGARIIEIRDGKIVRTPLQN